MLWIEKFRPGRLDEVLIEKHIRDLLQSSAESGSFPHLLVSGPHGTGKTTALDSFLTGIYRESTDENVTVIPAGTLFSRGRVYLESNPKFTHLYQKNQSVLANFKYIVRWHASIRPLNADFRVIIFDEADALPYDAQHALRRTMERFSETCRFIFVTTQAAALIDPIRSRCLPITFLPIPGDRIAGRLREILAIEGVLDLVPSDDIDLLAIAVRGDLRKAIMHLQVAVDTGTPVAPEEIENTMIQERIQRILDAVRSGDPEAARRGVETLMIEDGLSGREILMALRRGVRVLSNTPTMTLLLAETDATLLKSGNEFLQVHTFLTRLEEMQR